MEKITFKDLPSTDTPINSTNLNLLQINTEDAINEVLNLVYPIGRGFIDFTDTNYSNYLGFTWERELVGLTPVGYDADDTDFNTIGATGGEKTHTLIIDEMPTGVWTSGGQTGGINTFFDVGTSYVIQTNGTNINQPHNNMPPYKVVAYWKRTA